MSQAEHLRAIRLWIGIVIGGLVLSGLSAFPIETELRWMNAILHVAPLHGIAESTGLLPWIARVHTAYAEVNHTYPFLAYGTDWLAFAHLVIATAFIGAYREPARNRWIVTFGLIACAGVFPLALIAGQVRGIPWGWTLIDCSFAVFCAVPLWLAGRHLDGLEPVRSAPADRLRQKQAAPAKAYRANIESWLR